MLLFLTYSMRNIILCLFINILGIYSNFFITQKLYQSIWRQGPQAKKNDSISDNQSSFRLPVSELTFEPVYLEICRSKLPDIVPESKLSRR
jgi:hypothetical protein